jgi:hypothetical protein
MRSSHTELAQAVIPPSDHNRNVRQYIAPRGQNAVREQRDGPDRARHRKLYSEVDRI